MKPSQSKLFETIGLSAIVISLIFVAYQINQSNRIARGTTSYELSRNWMEINKFYITQPEMLELRDRPGFLPIFGVVLSNYDNLTEYAVLEPLREAVKQ